MLAELFRGLAPRTSDWVTLDATRVQAFADATEDWQFIHLDAARAAAQTPFGGPVCHGFLTLSMLSMMSYQVMPDLPEGAISVNYGFDRLRFVAPVPVGARVRGVFEVQDVVPADGHVTVTWTVTVEIDGGAKPALAAHWITRIYEAG